jgi:hypothetical protein
MPEAIFAHPRLARIYDPLDPDRGDLDGEPHADCTDHSGSGARAGVAGEPKAT